MSLRETRDRIVELVRAAEAAEGLIAPRCRHFGACGGCDLQHLPYPAQLRLKRRLVETALQQHEPTASCEVSDPLAAPAQWGYRNKTEMTFDLNEEGGLILGYSPKNKWWRRVAVAECPLLSERMLGAALATQAWAAGTGLSTYDHRQHRGFLRNLVVRESGATGDLLVNLVTSESRAVGGGGASGSRVSRGSGSPGGPGSYGEADGLCAGLVEALRPFAPTGVLRTVTASVAPIVAFDHVEVLSGEPAIRERAAGLDFLLSPQSFFQTNSAMAERLLGVIAQAACTWSTPALGRELCILDLFCGVGTIGLMLARMGAHGTVPGFPHDASVRRPRDASHAEAENRDCPPQRDPSDPADPDARSRPPRVIGVEFVAAAVESAGENAAANGITNAQFVCASAREYLRDPKGEVFDLVVIDPPRVGCGPRVIKWLLRMRPPRIVYVSCNPWTLAAELAMLAEAYDIGPLQPVDMFPQTAHVEAVVGLTAR